MNQKLVRGGARHFGATLAAGCLVSLASAQTITVDMTDDVVDFAGAQQVADLPGPDGRVSFREACAAANNTPGPQTIAFAIPQSVETEWSGGIAVLFMDYSVFQLTDDETTVDFATQTAYTGDTNPNGNEVGLRCAPLTGAPAILVSGDRCVIKGMDRALYVGYAIELAGNNNRVIGCTISGPLHAAVYVSGGFYGPPASGNIIGGTAPGEGNVLTAGNHGVRIDAPADNNIVIGNQLRGVYAGVAVRGNPYTGSPVGNRIGGPTAAERNLIAGAGTYAEEGFPDGAQVDIVRAVNTLVEGNYIGTTPDGLAPAPGQRGPAGVKLVDSTGTVIRNNVISGMRVPGVNHYQGQLFGAGIHVSSINADTHDTTVEGNIIGADPSGQVAVPNLYGIQVSPYTALNLPFETNIAGNLIAFNERAGIIVQSLVTGVTITGNSITDNGALGIDLLDNSAVAGVTPNDTGDSDFGGNTLQNFPVLSAASTNTATTHIVGMLNSAANQTYRVEFFASPSCDPSGNGEGEMFLGVSDVVTDASGNATIDAMLPIGTPGGWAATATATNVGAGNTSEFSACINVTGVGSVVGDLDGDGDVDLTDLTILLSDFDCVGAGCTGDVDGDGQTTLTDLALLLANFG